MAERDAPKMSDMNKGMKNSSPDAKNTGVPLKGPSVNSEPTRSSPNQQKTLGPRTA